MQQQAQYEGPGNRRWSVPHSEEANPQNGIIKQKRRLMTLPATPLTKHRLMGELLHIAKPLAHLCLMYLFGQNSWKPWIGAIGIDLSSLKLMGDSKDLNVKEKAELRRRTMQLLYYLMRSPFYTTYTKTRLLSFLGFVSAHVPLSGLVIRPVLEYLPTWQRMYFYVWAA